MKPDSNHLHQLIFYFIRKKFLSKNILYSNIISAGIINSYNLLIFLISCQFISHSQVQILLIIFNLIVYFFIYSKLFVLRYKNMKKKIALIFGVTGQDGSYLSEFLIKKGYTVHGIKRRSSSFNTGRIDHIYQAPFEKKRNFFLHYGDVTDAISVSSLIKKIKPTEIYNLAAQSHVSVSFEVPEYTANADAIGALRILEAIKFHGFEKYTKFYQAGTSEMFGKVQEVPQTEKLNFIQEVLMV